MPGTVQIGAVRGKGKEGNDVKGTSKGELMQAEKEIDHAEKLAENNKDKKSRAIAKTASVT